MKQRLDKVRQILNEKDLDAILVSSRSNLIYFTGYPFYLDDREAFLIITSNECFALASSLIRDELKAKAPFLILSDSSSSPRRLSGYISELIKKVPLFRIGFELNDITVEEYTNLKNQGVKYSPINLDNIRSVKDEDEIESITKACALGDQAFSYILGEIKPGTTEKEVSFLLETYFLENGAKPSFEIIVAFGSNSAVIHHVTGSTKLKVKDNILFDFGVKMDNYSSDMSRTVFIGKPTSEEKKIYETVRVAQEKSFKYLFNKEDNPDMKAANKIDQIARDYVMKNNYPNFPHSSHGIGIEIHEAPSLSPTSGEIIKPGMVFSVEPGIYLPSGGQGINNPMGVRIEDIVAMTNNGPQVLTKSSRELIVL